jgi:hypothetical protein
MNKEKHLFFVDLRILLLIQMLLLDIEKNNEKKLDFPLLNMNKKVQKLKVQLKI